MSQSVAIANSHDSCTHNTSVSAGRRGEKLAYGQSQCVTFGLEFTLGSDAHTNEVVRFVECNTAELWPCLRVRFTSLEAMRRKQHCMYIDIHKSNSRHLSSNFSLVLQTVFMFNISAIMLTNTVLKYLCRVNVR